MNLPSSWQNLFEALKVSPAGNLIDQEDSLDLLTSLAHNHSERLGMGVTAISELLEGAVDTDRVDDVLAGHICWMLAHMAGLSVQLAAVTPGVAALSRWPNRRGAAARAGDLIKGCQGSQQTGA